MEFTEKCKEKIALIEDGLDRYLSFNKDVPKVIYDAVRYSVFAGGKRIRPIIMLGIYELFSDKNNIDDVIPFACAIEMIHTYSLIHDDLPAMDNSDLRRGRPTNHKVYGEAMAVLAGDALLNTAFEVMLASNSKNALKCASIIAKSAGVFGMIGGQVMDIESESKQISIDDLKRLHTKKTGALIRASALCGAILSDASIDKINAAEEFAQNIGLAFQIKDDILNVIGDEQKLGKPINSDAKSNKNTYVSLLGLENSKKLLKKHTDLAIGTIMPYAAKDKFIIELSRYLLNREK